MPWFFQILFALLSLAIGFQFGFWATALVVGDAPKFLFPLLAIGILLGVTVAFRLK